MQSGPNDPEADSPRMGRAAGVAITLAFAWLWLQWTHEAGHVLAGLATGAGIQRVVLDPLIFSRTDLSPNPRPLIACWGGPIIGSILGAGLPVAVSTVARRWRPVTHAVACAVLLGNGAYIGLGVIQPVGDAATLLALGTPRWLLAAFGLACFALAAPLYRVIIRPPIRWPTPAQTAVVACAALCLAIAGRLLFPG
ncbi:MAG: hypothetical protein LAT64_07565 [Phycisphaerales bacterium]|nr:hypothetical protein [Planctomycetota bacterium]MCH8508614.1 hypothetical protein [Phycisphaerales bacterium]